MPGIAAHASELLAALRARADELHVALSDLDDDELSRPSALPGWSRLTIACHLRYGATTLHRMTVDAVAGRPTAYYPEGRDRQRPRTLEPDEGERPAEVVSTLRLATQDLLDDWTDLDPTIWSTPVHEPADNPDLGPTTLAVLLMAAATELEVHGTDLGVPGVSDWSPVFVARALPSRLERLNVRRTNHRPFDASLRRSWLLVADDLALRHRVEVDGDTVRSEPAAADGAGAGATIKGTARDLLALLLGRPFRQPLDVDDERDLDEFRRALPGP